MADSGLCCGFYRGTIYLKDNNDAAAALLPVGNAEATITQSLTEVDVPNYQSLGGKACKVSYIDSVNIDLTLHCTKPENLAIALMGTVSHLNGAAVSNEVHAVHAKGELIPLNFVHNGTTPIVVTGPSATPVYTLGTDYTVTPAGIIITEGSTIPVIGGNIEIDYTYGNNWKVDAQVVAQKEFSLVLDGFNVADGTQKSVILKAFKVKFSPTESFSLISGEDFSSIDISGEIISDATKTSGSKYFTVEFQP